MQEGSPAQGNPPLPDSLEDSPVLKMEDPFGLLKEAMQAGWDALGESLGRVAEIMAAGEPTKQIAAVVHRVKKFPRQTVWHRVFFSGCAAV